MGDEIRGGGGIFVEGNGGGVMRISPIDTDFADGIFRMI